MSTFPKRFEPLRDRLVKEAMMHPAFSDLDQDELVRTIENRLFHILQTQPWWFGRLGMDTKPKREASDAQREALAKARQRKRELQEEADAPYVQCERGLTPEEVEALHT